MGDALRLPEDVEAAWLDAPGAACYSCRVPNAPEGSEVPAEEIEAGRVLSAVAYLPGLCFIGLFGAAHNRYVAFHARQGLLLFLVEIAVWVALAIYDASLGAIPVVGFLVGALARFVLGFLLLAATIYGVVKGASGEMARIPYLGDAITKVPI